MEPYMTLIQWAQVYRGRLLSLADFLDNLPPERFDLKVWVGKTWRGDADISCGTTACALGWASAVPEFQKLGLVLTDAGHGGPIHPRIRDDEQVSFWDAVLNATNFIFGLNEDETNMLFVPTDDLNDEETSQEAEEQGLMSEDVEGSDGRLSRRATPRRVARHIRSFVELKYGGDEPA
jgi:hypothetical protein